ncbi:MAG TPA: hypothetical protein VF284_01245 [Rhodanobacteraceae bacterium]
MKLSAISIAIVLTGIVGVASAAGQQGRVMPPVNVQGITGSACTPPNDTTGHACDSYDQFLRANFTRREIGMLFGYQTAYPEYLTGGIDRLQRRYQVLLQQYVAAHSAANASATIAAK